jgi:plasmid replication initiation protein
VNINKKSLVVQSNRLVEAKYRLSVEEQKIIKILVSQIQKEDEDFKDYEFRIKDLAELLGMEHSNPYGVLRGMTKKLVSRVLEFYNPETSTLLQTSWLSSAEYKTGQGTVAMCFDPKLKPLLLQLQSYFTKYELGHILRFKGRYTIRFFEFRKSFLGRNKKEIVIDMRELREILGLKKSEYREFFNFKVRVLESARLELLEKTGRSFTWEPVRQGRGGKVTAIRFLFEGDSVDEYREPVVLLLPETPQREEGDRQSDENHPSVIGLLTRLGVSPQAAQELAGRYAEADILEKIAIVETHPEYVKNAAGFVITALQEDWKDAKIEERKRQEERRREEQVKQERAVRLRAIKQGFEMHAKNHALQQYEQVPETTRLEWRSEYLGTLAPILKKRYTNQPDFGFEDPYYRSFVMKYKLSALSLEQYLDGVGVSLDPEDRQAFRTL